MDYPVIGSSSQFSYRRRKKPPVENTKGKKPTGRNVGKLMQVMNVPVDVFLEIVSHLHPLDLLSLSRVSNDIRSMLLSRRTKSIWMRARTNLAPPLPDCPDDLSEPLYASLVFERSCMTCGAGRASWKVSYATRIRFCGSCWKTDVRRGMVLARDLGVHKDSQLMSSIFQLLPRTHDCAPTNDRGFDTAEQNAKDRYYAPDFTTVVEQYRRLRSGDESVFKKFLEERQADAQKRLIFYSAVAEWHRAYDLEKYEVDSKTEAERAFAVKLKLQELGYERADYPTHDYDFKKLLHQPRPLTSRIWNTIRPKLISILEPRRKTRLEAEFRLKWQTRWSQLAQYYASFLTRDHAENAWKRTMPSFATAVKMPHMLALLTAAEPDDPLPEEEFTAIDADVVKEGDKYRARARRDLVKILRRGLSIAATARKADLATKGKGKGKASASTGRGKVKPRASGTRADPDAGMADHEPVANDEALLDAPTALFRCCMCRPPDWDWSGGSMVSACATGILGHWQEDHSEVEWSSLYITCAPIENPNVRWVLDALELPEDMTLPALEEFLLAQTGTPRCTCYLPLYPTKSRYYTLCELLKHTDLNAHIMIDPEDGMISERVAHRITFAPAPEVVATTTAA